MNTLSWFLYFAGVAENIGKMFLIIALLIVIGVMFYCMASDVDGNRVNKVFVSIALIGATACVLLSALMPSQNTIYAIAASELGEQAYKSEIGQKASKAIEAWINSQLSKAGK